MTADGAPDTPDRTYKHETTFEIRVEWPQLGVWKVVERAADLARRALDGEEPGDG